MAKKKDKGIELASKLKPQWLRFVYLYLGAENGIAYGNATMAYFYAYNGEDAETKDKNNLYTKEYKTAKTEGNSLLTKPDIKAVIGELLVGSGYSPENIKKGIAELAFQRKNLPIALSAYEKMAKISGLLKEDNTVNVPELEKLTDAIKKILSH